MAVDSAEISIGPGLSSNWSVAFRQIDVSDETAVENELRERTCESGKVNAIPFSCPSPRLRSSMLLKLLTRRPSVFDPLAPTATGKDRIPIRGSETERNNLIDMFASMPMEPFVPDADRRRCDAESRRDCWLFRSALAVPPVLAWQPSWTWTSPTRPKTEIASALRLTFRSKPGTHLPERMQIVRISGDSNDCHAMTKFRTAIASNPGRSEQEQATNHPEKGSDTLFPEVAEGNGHSKRPAAIPDVASAAISSQPAVHQEFVSEAVYSGLFSLSPLKADYGYSKPSEFFCDEEDFAKSHSVVVLRCSLRSLAKLMIMCGR